MKTLAIAIMVRNEERIIERTLFSIKDIVDLIIVSDTGSTDHTLDLIKFFCEINKIKCEIQQTEWKNFGINRTELVKFAKDKSDYLLLLDADELVKLNNFDKNKLTADGYYVHYEGDLDYAQILLINNRLNWEYKSVTHEYIYSNEAKIYEELKGIKMQHFYDGSNHKDKLERDRNLLLQGIINEPKNSRYHFYLGQSYKDLKEYEKAIEYYLKTINLSTWGEEIFYSKYMIGYCLEQMKKLPETKIAYLTTWEFRPKRAEPLYRLSLLCRNNKEYQQAYIFAKKGLEIDYPTDHLFIEKPVYDYLLLFEKSISSYYVGSFEESYNDCKKLMTINNIPENIKNQNRINIQFSEQKLFGKIITSTFNKEMAKKTLKDVSEIFRNLKKEFFLMGGTLLGFKRDGDFLSHDDDIDIGIIGDEFCEDIKNEFTKQGFTFSLQFGIKGKDLEYRFYKYGIQVDLFFNYYENDKIYCGVFDNNGKSYKFIYNKFTIIPVLFKMIEVGIPSNIEKYLETQYGIDWIKENKYWNYLDAKNKH